MVAKLKTIRIFQCCSFQKIPNEDMDAIHLEKFEHLLQYSSTNTA